jgi:Ankyrin repeats (3 copies)
MDDSDRHFPQFDGSFRGTHQNAQPHHTPMQKIRSTMVLTELAAPPPALKRCRDEKSLSRPTTKRVKIQDTPTHHVVESVVANALLQLKSTTRSPMVQWTKLFDNASSDEYSSDEDEANMVQALVKASFSKELRRTSPAVARLTGDEQLVNPDVFIKGLVENPVKYVPASSLQGFFTEVTDEYVKGYTMAVVKAVREDDVHALRHLRAQGHTMLCGSKFGDSILHLACRRNCVKVVDFLLNEVRISPRLVCDYGRTPLHDALWVSQPNETIVKILLTACPDLLYVTDKRGSTPMAYLPKVHWRAMCRLLEHLDTGSLVPKAIHQ